MTSQTQKHPQRIGADVTILNFRMPSASTACSGSQPAANAVNDAQVNLVLP